MASIIHAYGMSTPAPSLAALAPFLAALTGGGAGHVARARHPAELDAFVAALPDEALAHLALAGVQQ